MVPARILVVDDDPVARSYFRELLEASGWEVEEAADWIDLCRCLGRSPFHLVILDVQLPGVTGDALAERIRDLVETHPGVLLLSALPEEDLAPLAKRVGALGYLIKGQDELTLRRTVQAALARSRKAVGHGPGTPSLPPGALDTQPPGQEGGAAVTEPRIDTSGWLPRVLLVDDSRTRRAYLRDWFEGHGFPLRVCASALEAMEFLKRARDEDLPEMVVSDVSMPDVTGLEFTGWLRVDPRFDEVPVILYTTTTRYASDPSTDVDALVAGASEYLRGAVAFERLLDAVHHRLETMRALRRLDRARHAIESASDDPGC